jgi:hypothetical protein
LKLYDRHCIPDECYYRNGYPGNSGDDKTSIMSIPDECYSRNGYPGNSGDHITSIIAYLMNVILEMITQVIVAIIKLQ